MSIRLRNSLTCLKLEHCNLFLAELKSYSPSGNDGFGVCYVVSCAVTNNLPENITSYRLGRRLGDLVNACTTVHGYNDIPDWVDLAPIERSNIRAKRVKIITDFLEKYLNDRRAYRGDANNGNI